MGRGRLCGALGVALLAAVLAGSAGGAGAAKQGATFARNDANQQFVPGQVVVGFRPNVDPVSRLESLSDASASTLKSIRSLNAKLVSVDGSVSAAIAELKSNPAVAYAEPNWIYHAEAVPNDPRYSQTYGLPKIQAPQAWDVTTGSAAVTVAVVDTGVSSGHPDLAPNMVAGANYVTGGANTSLDYNGHGTHVAGTIGARGNNGIGVAGVNWNVHLMPLRVLNGGGSGTNADIAAAFASTCTTHPAQIVNASLGGTGYSTSMRDAIASCPNVLFVVAAGNDGTNNDSTPHYPCNYGAAPDNLANVICVAATDQNDDLASFSNYGASVDLAAPGVGTTSTWPAYDTLYTQGFEDPFTRLDERQRRHVRPVDDRTRRGAYSIDRLAWRQLRPERQHALLQQHGGREPRRDESAAGCSTTCASTRRAGTTSSTSSARPNGARPSTGAAGRARPVGRSSRSRPTSRSLRRRAGLLSGLGLQSRQRRRRRLTAATSTTSGCAA